MEKKEVSLRHSSAHLRKTRFGLGITLNLLLGAICAHGQQIACGQTTSSSISSAGQTNNYTFSANAGEVVTILALGQTINAVADLYSPAGARIGVTTNNFTGPLNLTTTGDYTIQVHADNPAATGAYGVSLTFLTGRCGAPLIWGPPATGTVTMLAQVDSYTFSGHVGESVVINTASENLTAAAFVAGPNGAIATNWVNGTATLDPTSTGTYTVGVYSFYNGAMGTYSLSLFFSKLVPASYRLAIGTTNGAAALNIWGQVGRSTTVRYATNVATATPWMTLTNFSLPWSPYRFVDWASTDAAQRFYQTVQ